MFSLQSDFYVLVIREFGVHLVRVEKLLYNRDREQPMSILWYYTESLRCFPVIQLILPRFIGESMCFHPFVPYSAPFLFLEVRRVLIICLFVCLMGYLRLG